LTNLSDEELDKLESSMKAMTTDDKFYRYPHQGGYFFTKFHANEAEVLVNVLKAGHENSMRTEEEWNEFVYGRYNKLLDDFIGIASSEMGMQGGRNRMGVINWNLLLQETDAYKKKDIDEALNTVDLMKLKEQTHPDMDFGQWKQMYEAYGLDDVNWPISDN
jgi:hypothetical protein